MGRLNATSKLLQPLARKLPSPMGRLNANLKVSSASAASALAKEPPSLMERLYAIRSQLGLKDQNLLPPPTIR
jgi:hypothetical protein